MSPGDVAELWAQAQVSSLLGCVDGEPPAYGSLVWLRLAPGDPRKVAAIITAAEAYRRQVDEEARLDRLAEEDPEAYRREIYAEANAYASSIARDIALRPTAEEIRRRAVRGPAREVTATAGWPPVAIPGRPGWYRHLVDGHQVDRPTNAPQNGPARDH
ncbi:hypothetical protein [Streptomyces sp. S.PB5]|uniref:hypothetical protein n=1 Tax=Streptomyces sp. S.PB5 TaxID=3020844 RepID=UPI0025AF70F8|nr:hypothetical protein [Streptomyces sp. S.PB5]MDN3023817.1 hypothetical protein [Streptomyces sp. S.PB5]